MRNTERMTDDVRDLSSEAVSLVRQWLATAEGIPVPRPARQLAAMLKDTSGLDFVVDFVDQVVRPENLNVAATSMKRLAGDPPPFLDWHLRAAIRLGGVLAPKFPDLIVPIARAALRKMVGHLIVDATPNRLGSAISKLRKEDSALNLNLLGETVLGEREAGRRFSGTFALLARDDVDYVSVKVSSVVKPHQRWGFEEMVTDTVETLRPLYQLALSSPMPKFINLDMEEYKDLELTLAVFTRLLDEPQFHQLRAGIVLQAYLPDAMGAMARLQNWAGRRVAAGGAPIKVRLVKGANLPMELVDAQLHGWPLATVDSKKAADTNYKRVMDYALQPERIRSVELGIAGHNLFDIALAWLLAQRRGVTEGVDFEMLVGMAPGQAEAVRRTVGRMLFYVPVVHPKEFDVAIAYLIRRLEEGASQDNFMSAVFELSTCPELFERERRRFQESIDALSHEVPQPNRSQSRFVHDPNHSTEEFVPTSDSDPAIPANQKWAAQIRAAMSADTSGQELVNRSRLNSLAELNAVLETAGSAEWLQWTAPDRAALLHRVGDELAVRRGALMALAGSECGKTLDQSDPEVSEAIDFAHYYAEMAKDLDCVDGARHHSAGVVVVTPPWNFPLAIPAGSILAALAAGSSVIVKPSRLAARCCAGIIDAFWSAGVPTDALQFMLSDNSELTAALIADPRVSRVILTGGYETARKFKQLRPDLGLLAETSGKNAIIVTPDADMDLAVKDVVASAFGHAGQKCSAASLVILVGDAAKSRRFHDQLIDAVKSLTVGQPDAGPTEIGPLIQSPDPKLLAGLTRLEPGQRWILKPRQLDDDGRLWQPGIRSGVQRGSEFHLVEYFGPVLGIMNAKTLDEAIEIVNEISFGLTSGLHSLNPDEIKIWIDAVQAGNLYVNRGITGAIVQRQPFGGWKRSVVGPTTKAGGPNYLLGLSDWESAPSGSGTKIRSAQVERVLHLAKSSLSADRMAMLDRAARNDQEIWESEYGAAKDVQGIPCEKNVLRYLPYQEEITIRWHADEPLADLLRVVIAAIRSGYSPTISIATDLPGPLRSELIRSGFAIRSEPDQQFEQWLAQAPAGRIRMIGKLGVRPPRADLAIYDQCVTESGRLEMLPFLCEQTVSVTAHRFGTPSRSIAGILRNS